jgi:hypothetical protein
MLTWMLCIDPVSSLAGARVALNSQCICPSGRWTQGSCLWLPLRWGMGACMLLSCGVLCRGWSPVQGVLQKPTNQFQKPDHSGASRHARRTITRFFSVNSEPMLIGRTEMIPEVLPRCNFWFKLNMDSVLMWVHPGKLRFEILNECLGSASVVSWSEFMVTDPEVRVRFPALQDFLRSSGSGTGST